MDGISKSILIPQSNSCERRAICVSLSIRAMRSAAGRTPARSISNTISRKPRSMRASRRTAASRSNATATRRRRCKATTFAARRPPTRMSRHSPTTGRPMSSSRSTPMPAAAAAARRTRSANVHGATALRPSCRSRCTGPSVASTSLSPTAASRSTPTSPC